jgi:Pyruvate/2-oxoacid:ferredoxin oxidoreductase delta subunit
MSPIVYHYMTMEAWALLLHEIEHSFRCCYIYRFKPEALLGLIFRRIFRKTKAPKPTVHFVATVTLLQATVFCPEPAYVQKCTRYFTDAITKSACLGSEFCPKKRSRKPERDPEPEEIRNLKRSRTFCMYMSIEYIPCVIERAWATDLDKSFFV